MYKLLIADDEYEILSGLCKYFPWNEVGFEVVGQVENGKQALDYIQNNIIDVLLCDIKMPIMSGIELAEKLHSEKSNVKVIFLSGYREFEFAQKALSLGVKNYILKSTKSNELVNVFKKVKEELDSENKKKCQFPEFLSESTPKTHSYDEKIISAIKQYISENYKTVELEDISKLIHMSPNYISKFFKLKTEQNFSEFLLLVRMEKAIELLKDIKYKIYEVSNCLGYSNGKNFARTFKTYYGISPREFRNNELLLSYKLER